jgi:hypothetical protein
VDGRFRSTWAKADAPPGRCGRLSKDLEHLAASQENVSYLATVVLLLHRATKALP